MDISSIIDGLTLALTLLSPLIMMSFIFIIIPEYRYRLLRIDYHPFFILTKNGNLKRCVTPTSSMTHDKFIRHNKHAYLFKDEPEYTIISKNRISNLFKEGSPLPIAIKNIKEGLTSYITDIELSNALDQKITDELNRLITSKTDLLLLFLIIISIGISLYVASLFNSFSEQYTIDINTLMNLTKSVHNNVPVDVNLLP